MSPTAPEGGTTAAPPAALPNTAPPRRPAPTGFLAAALLLHAAAVAGPLQAQESEEPSVSSAEVTVRMEVEDVVHVSPESPVVVRFPSRRAAAGEPVEARAPTSLSCAGNTRHGVRVRLLSREGSAPTAARRGVVQWSADGGASWSRLDDTPARAAGPFPPGRRPECATVRFRWVPPAAEDPARPPERVRVDFGAEALDRPEAARRE